MALVIPLVVVPNSSIGCLDIYATAHTAPNRGDTTHVAFISIPKGPSLGGTRILDVPQGPETQNRP